jgi:hypothetical protein
MNRQPYTHTSVFIIVVILLGMFNPSELLGASQLRLFNNDAGLFDPSAGPVTINYQLTQDARQIEVRIIDFRGQVANRFSYVELRAGDHSFSWDGTDNNGDPVMDGRYQFVIAVDFVSGLKDGATVDIMVATIADGSGFQVPQPLPPEKYPHQIYGSASSFYRYNDEREDRNDGEVRLRAGVDYGDERNTARGVFQVIQDYQGSAASFNGSQAMAQRRWDSGNIKGVFRDNLGSFQDPMQLFSDFRTERNKIGAAIDQSYQQARLVGLLFTSEGDVDSRERGAATRLTYGDRGSLQFGASYTYRGGIEDLASDNRISSHAAAMDALYPLTDSFLLAAELVATDDELLGSDYGGVIKAEYDLGTIRLSAGYVNLGENFRAEFSDPLRQVYSDAQGIDASVDYFMQRPVGYFSSFSATLRFFSLSRPSNDSDIQELDGSLRFGIGANDSFFMSVFHRDDEFGTNSNYMGNMTHSWNETWSNLIQVNYSETDTSDTLRLTFNTIYTARAYAGRLSLEWTRRTIDYSRFSPYDQTYIRFDLENDLYHLQLQGKYSYSGERSGFNGFGRLDYMPEYLHRYRMLLYCSLGNRASLETEEQLEFGLEVQF